MKILCLSNGHGEDAIAVRILLALQQHPDAPEVMALPLVGEGRAFVSHGIPLVGPVKPMPSGGFVYMDNRQLMRDVRGGLLQLTWQQFQAVKQWAAAGAKILAVGDLWPLLFAWLSGVPFAFVGTAKTEYYLRDEVGWLPRASWFTDRTERWLGSVYYPWERCLMRHKRCRAVFPRDRITTESLQKSGIAAFDLGNPMMDGLEPTGHAFAVPPDEALLTIALLPGSRPPEAYRNWALLLRAVDSVLQSYGHRPLLLLGAIAPGLEVEPLTDALSAHQWQPAPSPSTDASFTCANATLILTQTAYADCLHRADFALAMAGTATEQFAGLGKPALIIAGEGPQFTPSFAEAQTRLLGPSVTLLSEPEQAAPVVRSLLNNPDRLQLIAENGRRRMGTAGAAQRIAAMLMQRLVNSTNPNLNV